MFILIIKPDHQPAYAQAFQGDERLDALHCRVLARIDSPADVDRYLTRHDFGGPIKAYGSVEKIARSIGWLEPLESLPRPQLLLPLC